MRYLVEVSFDGSNYVGFQRQLNGNAIENEIEKAFKNMTKIPTKIYSSGRTDKGVHAKALTFHFDSDLEITLENWVNGLNKRLPLDIRVNKIKVVKASFHARYSAKARIYQYYISKKPNTPFNQRYEVYIEGFDYNKALETLNYFIGKKDFRGFSKAPKDKDTIKEIYEFTLKETKNHYIFTIKGSSFLRYMVRSIIGTIIEIATNRKDISVINEIFKTHNRKLAGKSAEARGLYLKRVIY